MNNLREHARRMRKARDKACTYDSTNILVRDMAEAILELILHVQALEEKQKQM